MSIFAKKKKTKTLKRANS